MSFEKSAGILKKITSGNKLRIVQILISGPQSVSDLLNELKIEQSLLSHHLKELRQLGFLSSFQKGRNQFYSISTNYHKEGSKTLNLGCCQLSF